MDHMGKVLDATELMRDVVSSFCRGSEDFDEEVEAFLDKKVEADEVKRSVIEELSKGKFPSTDREKIMRLVTSSDEIAENARAAVEKLPSIKREALDEEVSEGLNQLSQLAHESVKLLHETFSVLLHDNIEKSLEKAKTVEKMEEKVDHFRATSFTPRIVKWSDGLGRPGTSNLLWKVEADMEEVVDQAEKCCDAIREIAIGAV